MDFLTNLNSHTLAQFLASSANSEAAANEEIANLDRWIDEAGKRVASLTEQLQFEKRRLVELRDRKRLSELDLANAQAATTVLTNELGGRQRRKAELNRINRKRVGLPPLVNIPVKEKGWVTLELETGDKLLKVCGNCANWYHDGNQVDDGKCSFHQNYCNAASYTCTYFDPLPLPSTPPAEAVAALDQIPTPEEMEVCDARR